jgi:hypothetical protein
MQIVIPAAIQALNLLYEDLTPQFVHSKCCVPATHHICFQIDGAVPHAAQVFLPMMFNWPPNALLRGELRSSLSRGGHLWPERT